MNYNALKAVALQMAEQLTSGTCRRVVCPACAGGASGEVSFTVGREADRVWFKCFRASCGARGIVGSYGLTPDHAQLAAVERINPYTGETRPLDSSDRVYFQERFGLDNPDVYVSARNEYILPYRNQYRKLRGHVIRTCGWQGTPATPRVADVSPTAPKTITHVGSLEPVCGWFLVRYAVPSGQVVIVEDLISAQRVAEAGFTALALLGSGMRTDIVRDIRSAGYRSVLLALDPDAQGTAQQMRVKWGGYFEKCRIVALEADPKDTPTNELAEVLL